MSKITFDTAWELLRQYEVATFDELVLVTSINGSTVETLEHVLYSRTSLRSFEQLVEELKDE